MKQIRLDGTTYPVKHYPTTCDRHTIVMLDPTGEKTLAYLIWHEWTGEIRQVRIECPNHEEWAEHGGPHYCYFRRGIATALLAMARSFASVPIVHSPDRTEAGNAWVHAVALPGEEIPPRRADTGTVSHRTMEELMHAL